MQQASLKGKLDSKVSQMRSQSLSFSNNGIQVAISIPDTEDVKNTFGSVVDTVVDQQEEIADLNQHVDKVAKDADERANSIYNWSKECIDKLQDQNDLLLAKLNDALAQLKNFAYNMQGYVDNSCDEVEIPITSKFVTQQVDLSPMKESTTDIHALPAIEEPSNEVEEDEAAVEATAEKEAMEIVETKVEVPDQTEEVKSIGEIPPVEPQEPVATATEEIVEGKPLEAESQKTEKPPLLSIEGKITPRKEITPRKGPVEDPVSPVGINQIQAPNLRRPKSSEQKRAATAYYRSVRPNYLPFDNKGRWRWAIFKVIIRNRMKSWQFGFTRTRLDKNMTIAHRIERMERDILGIPDLIEQKSRQETSFLLRKMEDEVGSAIEQVALLDERVEEVSNAFKDKVDDIGNELNDITSKVSHIHDEVKETTKGLLMSMGSRIDLLTNNIEALFDLYLGQIRDGVLDIEQEVSSLERHSDSNMKALESFAKQVMKISNNTDLASDQLVAMLKLDTSERQLREEVAGFRASLPIVRHSFQRLKHCLRTIQLLYKSQKKPEDGKEINIISAENLRNIKELVTHFDGIESRFRQLEEMLGAIEASCHTHDEVLKEKWQALFGLTRVMESSNYQDAKFDHLQQKVVELSSTVENNASMLLESYNSMQSVPDVPATADEVKMLSIRLGLVERRIIKASLSPDEPPTEEEKEAEQNLMDDLTGKMGPLISTVMDARLKEMEEKMQELLEEQNLQNQHQNRMPKWKSSRAKSKSSLRADSVETMPTEDAKPHQTKGEEKSAGETEKVEMNDELPSSPPSPREIVQLEEMSEASPATYRPRRRADSDDGSSAISHYFDPSSLIEELRVLKRANTDLAKQVEDLNKQKFDQVQTEQMVQKMLTDYRKQESKSSQKQVVADVERSVKEVIKELIALRKEHQKDISELQQKFNDNLQQGIMDALSGAKDQHNDSFVNTRSLCLSCGRDSLVRQEPLSRPISPSFLPTLGMNSIPGPDVYRAGFKIPVRAHSPPELSASTTMDNYRPGSRGGVKSAGNTDSYTPTVHAEWNQSVLPNIPIAGEKGMDAEDAGDSLYKVGGGGSLSIPSVQSLRAHANTPSLQISNSTGGLRAGSSSGLRSVRHAQGKPESEATRPIFRKGFPGKKSLRAEAAYAPERFDLPGPQGNVFGAAGTPDGILNISRMKNNSVAKSNAF